MKCSPQKSRLASLLFALVATASLPSTVACQTTTAAKSNEKAPKKEAPTPPPLSPVTERRLPADPPPHPGGEPVLLVGGTVMTAAGDIYAPGSVLLRNGRIEKVGPGRLPDVDGVKTVDVTGRFVTPGVIDSHSHVGVYAYPGVSSLADGNEMTSPATPEVWAEHSFWPQDPALALLRAGGVTAIQVLPGSANLIGGRSFIAKLHPKVSAREMRFVGATPGMKMACGENPKRVYGSKGRAPGTRMGNVAGYRAAFEKAVAYKRKWDKYERDFAFWQQRSANGEKKDPPSAPSIDYGMETLKGVLENKIFVHNHCYRADEMHIMLDLAEQYGFTIRSFHHALEAYKLRHRLAEKNVSVSTWADWWGFKMEAFDGIPHNAALLHAAGAKTIIHSDSAEDIRRLNQEAAKARRAGEALGIKISDDELLRWITANPAWALGVDDQTGTLEEGKMADVVVWSGNPFSVYSRADLVFIDGVVTFDRKKNANQTSDFLVGITESEPPLTKAERDAAASTTNQAKGGQQ